MSDGNGGVTIPGWAVKMLGAFQVLFGILFSIGINLMMDTNKELQGLHTEVTTLNVQMQQALRTEEKFETLRDQFNTLSLRVAHIEGKREAQGLSP
jgi:hypothetical protein